MTSNKNIINVFFYLGCIIQLFYIARIITINSYKNSAKYVLLIIILFLICILVTKYTKRELLILLILGICSFIHLIKTGDTNLIRLIIIVFAAKNVDSKQFKRFILLTYIIFFVSVIIMSIYGGFGTVYQEGVWRVTKGYEKRYNLGFDGATRMMFIWICIIVSLQIYQNKLNVLRDAFLFFISLYLFKLSVSFTGILGSILALITPYLFNISIKKIGYSNMGKIIRGCLIFVLLLTFIAMVVDISATRFSAFLNGRTAYLHYIFSNGIYPSFFGGSLPSDVPGLDNSYFYNIYLLGTIPMLIMLGSIWKLSYVFSKKRDIIGASCTIVFIFVAYVTQTFEYAFLNYFLFLIIMNWKDVISHRLLTRSYYNKYRIEKSKNWSSE